MVHPVASVLPRPDPSDITGEAPRLGVREQQARLASAFARKDPAGTSYLLILRFALVNLLGLAGLGAAFMRGWVEMVRAADPTHQCTAIACVFAAGLVICAHRIWKVSRELNEARAETPAEGSKTWQYLNLVQTAASENRAMLASALKAKLMTRIGIVRHIANSLVILGLIGTVVGFIIALSGVKPDVAGDVKAVAPMVSQLILGMSVALYTTLVGAVLNVWLMANFHLLATGTVNLVAAIVERGEADVGR